MTQKAASDISIQISIADQRLDILQAGEVTGSYAVSTAANGAGEQEGSGCTPRGRHIVRAKIGGGSPVGSVFVGRRLTGEVYNAELATNHPERDWILSRILWLSGLEPGVNRLGDVDTQRRYIYIHGCPDSEPMGVPRSHGCVRMRNSDICELFELVKPGTPVTISE